MPNRYTLGSDGYFRRDGQFFVPTGANWWPGSCGVELWRRWPVDEIQRDLDLLKSLGFNTMRFFLRWQDFEPVPGVYDQSNLERLDQLLLWFRERDLAAHPSLFVGFMSGGVFWPAWKNDRNLFSDAFMRERSVAFTKVATEVIARRRECVLSIDQGNEMCCLGDSRSAPPDAVAGWCADVNRAIRSVWPDAVIISGNEQNQINADTGWRLDTQPGCDLLSMHTYPVPGWHVVGFDGMTDPLAQSLLPFYTKVARAFRPVMVQEFGTIVTFGTSQQEAYLRAILPACWSAGSNGFLWWCLRDIDSGAIHPYVKNGFEGTLGLVDAEGRVKPGLEYFPEFCRGLSRLKPVASRTAGTVGLYWPRHWWNRDNPANNANDPWSSSRRLTIANHLINRSSREVSVIRGDHALLADVDTIVVPGINLRVDEAQALLAWVEQGGKLLWHGPDPVNWGDAYVTLLGAVPVDYRATPTPRRGSFGGETWEFSSFPRGMRCQVESRGAEVLSRDQQENPLVLRNRIGKGVVVAAMPIVEDAPAGIADRVERDRWSCWYAAGFRALGGE